MKGSDLWLILGLTVILTIAISFSTVTITGNAVKSDSLLPVKCTDSDGGNNIYVKGTATGILPGQTKPMSFTDTCRNGDGANVKIIGVEEGQCGNVQKIKCNSNNEYCENNACASCDSTGYHLKITKIGLGSGTNVIPGPNWYKCEYGCENGACLKKSSSTSTSTTTSTCQIIGKGAQELPPNGPQITSVQLCETLSKEYKPIAIIQEDSFVYHADSQCKGDVIFADLQTKINWRDTNAFLRVDAKGVNGWTEDCEKSGITHDGKAVYVTRTSSSVKDVICCK